MEGFLSEIEVLLPVLGFDLLRKAADAESLGEAAGGKNPSCLLTLAGPAARAREAGGEFVVLSGSTARVKETQTCPEGIKTLRRELVKDKAFVLEAGGEFYRFARDVPFGSPSGAAATVYGGKISGRKRWKVEASELSYGKWRDECPVAAQRDSA